jgi:plastocyanin
MTDPDCARVAGRMAATRSRRQVLSAVGKGTAVGLGAALVARPLGLIGNLPSAAAQGAASVSIVDFAFDPGSVTVDVGGTVTWTNQGPSAHTATADDGSFDSGTLDAGGTFSFTFNTAGTFSYHCAIHPNMVGTVVVNGGSTSGGSTSGGTTTETPPATVMPATGSGPTASDTTPWLGVALAGGAAAWLAGRTLRKDATTPEQ